MPAPQPAFEETCLAAARSFLQTVIIIDEEAEFEPTSAGTKALESDKPRKAATPGDFASRTDKEVVATPSIPTTAHSAELSKKAKIIEPDDSVLQHSLNASDVIHAFADQSILASIYKPLERGDDDTIFKRSLGLTSRSDISILDWRLFGDGEITKRIIKETYNDEVKTKGKLKLIFVYSGTPDPQSIRDEIADDFAAHTGVNATRHLEDNVHSLETQGFKVCVINKYIGGDKIEGSKVPYRELPDFVVRQFAKFCNGLICALVVDSIAHFRDSTYKLLNTFSSDIDGAFLGHRIQLSNAEDSREFALKLILSELRSVLEEFGVSDRNLDDEVILNWVGENLAKSGQMTAGVTPFSNGTDLGGKIESINKKLMRDWIKGQSKITKVSGAEISQSTALKYIRDGRSSEIKSTAEKIDDSDIGRIFYENRKTFNQANQRLARMSTLSTEAYDRTYNAEGSWNPTMSQGTLFLTITASGSEEFHLCIEPACDCLRLESPKEFKFLKLRKQHSAKEPFNLILKTDEETEKN